MERLNLPPAPMFLSTPVVLVTCVDETGKPNIVTLAWSGVVNSAPPMVGISIRPSRHSYACIKRTKEFVVNLPSEGMVEGVDACGVLSGKDTDKFASTGWHAVPAQKVKPPLIEECPVQLECQVKKIIPLGSHELFLGQVIALHVVGGIQKETGRIDLKKCPPLIYSPGAHEYWSLGKYLGDHGFTKGRP